MGGKRLTTSDRNNRNISEKDWQKYVISKALYNGWTYYHPPDNKPCNGRIQKIVAGFPDLVLLKGSKITFVELKTETGKTSLAQKEWLAKLAATGSDVFVWRPSQYKEVNKYLEEN